MMAADIAGALGGKPSGLGYLCHCPVDGHGIGRGDRNPSLSIADGETTLLVRCFAGCGTSNVLDVLRRRGLIEHREPQRACRPRPKRQNCVTIVQPDAKALQIWREAKPPGDAVRTYLVSRRITIALPATIRQSVRLEFDRIPMPTMVVALQAPDKRVIAAQQLRLTWTGTKAPVALQRLTTGRLYDGAVRLGPAANILGLAEGIETALAAMQLTGVPTWASLGAERLPLVRIAEEVRELHVFADADEAGQNGARRAADRWRKAGVTVMIRTPPVGFGDWADLAAASARPRA